MKLVSLTLLLISQLQLVKSLSQMAPTPSTKNPTSPPVTKKPPPFFIMPMVPTSAPTQNITLLSVQPEYQHKLVGQEAVPTSAPTRKYTLSPTSGHPEKYNQTTSSTNPSISASASPSSSVEPSNFPSESPSKVISEHPTESPSAAYSENPSSLPSTSNKPTSSVSPTSSSAPSESPTSVPSAQPSVTPSALPSNVPTRNPTPRPTFLPSTPPSDVPTSAHVEQFNSNLIMFIDIFSSAMDDVERESFAKTLKQNIESTLHLPTGVTVELKDVEITSQVRGTSATVGVLNEFSRRMQEFDGLLIETLVTGLITYGQLPNNFDIRKEISSALMGDFDNFVSKLKSDQTLSAAIRGDAGLETDSNGSKRKSFIIWISVACGAGGMIMGALLLVSHSRRKKIRAFRQAADRHLNNPRIFDGCNQSCTSSYIEEDEAEKWVPVWDQNKIYNSNSYTSDMFHRSKSSEHHGSENNSSTPVSTSTASMGIILSPGARNEAMKHQQHFLFEPHAYLQEVKASEEMDTYMDVPFTTFITYATPGPVGVVIETTRDGPMVHSVRPTSQLLGTVMPGDIIIGLDNIETKELVAPALTRLMARKSQQERRKITFLRPMK